jgi:hypothetical protein
VEEFGMTPNLRRIRGKEAAAIHLNVDFLKKLTIESPLLPSPYTDNIPCHPETHPPLATSLKQLIFGG